MAKRGGRRNGAGRPRLPDEALSPASIAKRASRSRQRAEADEQFAARGLRRALVGEPPEGLDETEQHCWRKLGKAANSVGVITSADLPLFQLLVEAQARLDKLRLVALATRGASGRAVRDYVALAGRVAGFMDQIGLTPASRARLRPVAEPKPTEQDRADPDDIRPLPKLLRMVPPAS
jgi:phage terminase small subunit